MNLKQFHYVLVLAQEGSFSKAADVLSIRQPSLSQYIKKIEQEIGAELFNRSGGNVHLTDAGRAYIEIGRKMLDLEHQLEEKLSELKDYRTGTLTVGISAHRSVAFMPEVVTAFREMYPGIVLRIVEKKRGEIIEAAEHGEFDICLTTLPVDRSIFSYETVFVEENVVAVPASVCPEAVEMPDRKFPAIPVRMLDQMPFILLNKEHPMQRELDCLCSDYGISVKGTVECTSLEAMLEMVKCGAGCAFVPSCIAKPFPSVRYYSIREKTEKREIVLVSRKEQTLSRSAEALKQTIREILGNR